MKSSSSPYVILITFGARQEVPMVVFRWERWRSCKKSIYNAMDDTAPIVEERHFPWNTLLGINKNPYVKMMIFAFGQSEGRNFVTAGWLFRRGLVFQKWRKTQWFLHQNAVTRTVSKHAFHRLRSTNMQRHPRQKRISRFERLRTKESRSIKKVIFRWCGKVAVTKCVEILMREWHFCPHTRYCWYHRWMKKKRCRWRSRTRPIAKV